MKAKRLVAACVIALVLAIAPVGAQFPPNTGSYGENGVSVWMCAQYFFGMGPLWWQTVLSYNDPSYLDFSWSGYMCSYVATCYNGYCS